MYIAKGLGDVRAVVAHVERTQEARLEILIGNDVVVSSSDDPWETLFRRTSGGLRRLKCRHHLIWRSCDTAVGPAPVTVSSTMPDKVNIHRLKDSSATSKALTRFAKWLFPQT